VETQDLEQQLEATKGQYRALLEQAMKDNQPQLRELLEKLPKGQRLRVTLQLQAFQEPMEKTS
jgi:hypothetical protein